jgi:predicted transcriptional regulator of viral defense system
MRFLEIAQKLAEKKYYVFSFAELSVFYPNANSSSLRQYLSRWKKNGWIGTLKKGLYELKFPEDRRLPDLFIANKMYGPSYVSLETALSHYSLIPEVAMAVMSLTSKTTRRFKNAHGLFVYRSVRPEAMRGYVIEKHNGFDVLIAEPEKALVDYCYFKTLRGRPVDLAGDRLDKNRIAKLNKRKLESYARVYGLALGDILDA